jgi:hypothetical protein
MAVLSGQPYHLARSDHNRFKTLVCQEFGHAAGDRDAMPRSCLHGCTHTLSDRACFRGAETGEDEQKLHSAPPNGQVRTSDSFRQRLAGCIEQILGRSRHRAALRTAEGTDIEQDDAQLSLFTTRAGQFARDSGIAAAPVKQRRV